MRFFCGNAEPNLQAECLGNFSRAAQTDVMFLLPICKEHQFSWSDRRIFCLPAPCYVGCIAEKGIRELLQNKSCEILILSCEHWERGSVVTTAACAL